MLLTLQINANNIADGVATFQLENALAINKMTLLECQMLLDVAETTQFGAGTANPRLYASFNNIDTQSIIVYGSTHAKSTQNSIPLFPSYSSEAPAFGGMPGAIMYPFVVVNEPTILPADISITLFEMDTTSTSTIITSEQIDSMFEIEGEWVDNTHINLVFEVELNSSNRMNLND